MILNDTESRVLFRWARGQRIGREPGSAVKFIGSREIFRLKFPNSYVEAVVYTGFRGWGRVPGAMGGYFLTLEKSKISRFFKLENFQKMLKKQWKIYNFLKIFKEILRFFENFLKFYRNFRENLGKNLENMHL